MIYLTLGCQEFKCKKLAKNLKICINTFSGKFCSIELLVCIRKLVQGKHPAKFGGGGECTHFYCKISP